MEAGYRDVVSGALGGLLHVDVEIVGCFDSGVIDGQALGTADGLELRLALVVLIQALDEGHVRLRQNPLVLHVDIIVGDLILFEV